MIEDNLLAQEAEKLEHEEHERIMSALKRVRAGMQTYHFMRGSSSHWEVDALPLGEPERIARRGNHEEILYMIHQYGKTRFGNSRDRFWFGKAEGDLEGAVLSDTVQRIILERNDIEEIEAYLKYRPFSPAGQNFILDRGDHEEIMRFLKKHGFAPEQQLRLFERGNLEEIRRQMFNCACDDLVLTKLFDELQTGEKGARQRFMEYIMLHPLPVAFQIRLLKSLSPEIFMAYIDGYPFADEANADLVVSRSAEEVVAYIEKYPKLSREGEEWLVASQEMSVVQYYLEMRSNRYDPHIFSDIIKAKPFNRELVETFFFTYKYSDKDIVEEECNFVKTGHQDDILEYIQKKSLSLKAVSELFFREGFEECFRVYAKKWYQVDI